MSAVSEAIPIPRTPIHLATEADRPLSSLVEKPPWFYQRLLDLRMATMTKPTKPYWNTTMVTAWVAVVLGVITVLGAVGGLYIHTRDTSKADGVQIGIQMERDRVTQELLKKQADEIDLLKRAAGLLPPEPKKEKK